jgi:hypothetical protein
VVSVEGAALGEVGEVVGLGLRVASRSEMAQWEGVGSSIKPTGVAEEASVGVSEEAGMQGEGQISIVKLQQTSTTTSNGLIRIWVSGLPMGEGGDLKVAIVQPRRCSRCPQSLVKGTSSRRWLCSQTWVFKHRRCWLRTW